MPQWQKPSFIPPPDDELLQWLPSFLLQPLQNLFVVVVFILSLLFNQAHLPPSPGILLLPNETLSSAPSLCVGRDGDGKELGTRTECNEPGGRSSSFWGSGLLSVKCRGLLLALCT